MKCVNSVGIAFIIAGCFLFSCARSGDYPPPDPQKVAAVSSGVLGRTEPVKVVFTESQDITKPLTSSFFVFSPAVKGTVSWQDEYTLVFTPSEPLKPGQHYQVSVGGNDIDPFSFDFMTAFPSFDLVMDSVRIDENGDVIVQGIVNVDKDAEISQIEAAVKSAELGKLVWVHEFGEHRFSFAPVQRLPTSRTVAVNWDGKSLGNKEKGFSTVLIPGTDVFEVIGFRQEAGFIEVSFSSAIKEYDDLRGFLSLSGKTDVRYSLEGNLIRIFGDDMGGISSGAELFIQDIEDVDGRRLVVPVQYQTNERWELPEIRFAGTGTILPTSQGSQLVVETKNVSGLLVEAFQIYGDNMIQFLQVNGLDGERELERVGEPVWTKAFDLPWAGADKNRWIRRGLDISELSRKFPGGMFRIRVSFRQRHVHYECTVGHGDYSRLTFPDDSFPEYQSGSRESSYWDSYQNSSGYSWYDWYRSRRDPCHPAYYMPMDDHNITIGRNVIVSNLGLLAKRSLNGSWLIAATNLLNANPASGAEYRVYNYQGRVLASGKTGADGMALIPNSVLASTPNTRLFLYAQSNLGRAYLRINDSLALAVSHFDVAGGSPASGIRGLIYGERGVWRPGDDIFLTFLLSDPERSLPQNHPVSFELEDPRGRLVLQRSYTSSVDGFYPITASTASDAPTGDWIARVRVGGVVFNRIVKVETVMPNRLKMELDFGPSDVIKSGPHDVSLEAQWLYGAKAPGLKSNVSVSFQDRETGFAGYGDYSFRDPSRRVSSERQTLWDGTLDADGKSAFNMNLRPGNQVPGKVSAQFLTRVFEPSGVFSSEQISREYSPYKRYAGIKLPKGDASRNMLLTDTNHPADIVLLDEDGKPVQGEVELSAAIYKLSWRWWWEAGIGEPAEFASTLSRSPLSRETITAVNGKASWNFRVNYPDWGRYLVIVRDSAGGHAAAQVVYIDWPGWAGRAQEGGQDSSAMLSLSPEKQKYNAGEKVSISFPSNDNAAALAVVEKGGNILKSEWINCKEGTSTFEFTADPSMVPNVYIHITLLQPHLQTANDLPVRLYGIVPVTVEDPRVILQPRITAQDTWLPESTVSFTVSETQGRPMAYTVAVVDEGLLGLTRFSLPNPRNTFYAREASFLKSWDLFRDIIGAYSGRLETLLAIGGGDDGVDDGAKETQRFKPVVRFFGPYQLKPNEQKTETFDLPPYIGAVRIMVMAASSTDEVQTNGSQRAYGTTEKAVKVASDLMVFASLPRTLSPGDEAIVPVYVNSYQEGSRTVRVNLTVPGASVQGPSFQDVAFDRPGEKLVRFTVQAPANPRNLTFTLSAESAGLRSARHETDLEVRSTAIPVSQSTNRLVSPGETWQGTINYPGREGTNTLAASFSRIPPLNMESRLNFLISYPHGCIEQTTSGVFPQIYLNKVLSLDGNRLAEIRSNVAAGIERISSMQVPSGGFSYWPGDSSANDWGTSYAGHFLLEARTAGYAVSDNLIQNWLNYQKNQAASWQSRNSRYTEQAYRLYTIALAGQADIGSMNRLREQKDIPLQSQWRLAAAYWYAGQRDIARNMIQELSLPEGDYRELSGTFGSALRDKAMILETLILLGSPQDAPRIKTLFENISAALSQDSWLSTQETAYALIAVAPYIQSSAGKEALGLDYSVAGRSGNVSFTSPVAEQDFGNVSGGGAFTVTNRSAAPVYVTFTARGLPEEGSEPALSAGLALQVEYRNSNGRAISPEDIKQGEDIEVRVTVRNTHGQNVEEIALVVPVPASWEIINTRLAGSGALSSEFRYQDIRDDRVMTYFHLNRDQSKTVRFTVSKTYDGVYYRPAIHAYAMYDESIRALIPGVR